MVYNHYFQFEHNGTYLKINFFFIIFYTWINSRNQDQEYKINLLRIEQFWNRQIPIS